MNALIQINANEATMTTVEIAELTGKTHANVLRDTRAMLGELYGESNLIRFEEVYRDSRNRKYPCYRLPKKEVLVLISGYSIKLRMKIVTRLEELENRAKDPMAALSDPAAMRCLLLTYTEKVLALEESVAEQKPKADVYDRIANADGFSNITNTAKILQVRPKDLFSLMSAEQWIYRRAGGRNWVGYQKRIQQGLLTHKITTVSTSDGREKSVEQVCVTPKGLTTLAGMVQAES